MDKLKPCPFCGTKPARRCEHNWAIDKDQYWVECVNEKCLIQPVTPAYTCKGADVRAWNRRSGGDSSD